MSIAVAVDEFVTWVRSLPREEALRVLREMPPTPTALRDQLEAARADAVRVAEMLGGDDAFFGGAPGWASLSATDALVSWSEGESRTCMHNPDPLRPSPVFACAWKPRLIVCAECTHLFRVSHSAPAACDGCGFVCSGVEGCDGIHPVSYTFGMVVFLMGFCGRCAVDSELEYTA